MYKRQLSKTSLTEQDEEFATFDRIAKLLRRRPLLPPHPDDHTLDWVHVDSGIAFPRAHCAFSDCNWSDDTSSWDLRLKDHIRTKHLSKMQLSKRDQPDFMAFYCAAIRVREMCRMPSVGISIDRRTFKLLADVYNSEQVYNAICFICAQTKTHTGLKSEDGKNDLSDMVSRNNEISRITQKPLSELWV